MIEAENLRIFYETLFAGKSFLRQLKSDPAPARIRLIFSPHFATPGIKADRFGLQFNRW